MKSLQQLLEPYRLAYQTYEQLSGYDSINYRLKNNETNYLLKHYTDTNNFSLITAEDDVLKALNKGDLPYQIPVAIKEFHTYDDASFSRLLPFIEGELLSGVKPSDELLFNFGEATGLLNNQLLNIKNNTIKARESFWDMKQTLLNVENATLIENSADRKLVNYFFDLFEHKVLPIQKKLRHSIIHSDLNDNNIIVENEKVKGIIDFGDIAYSPLIYEVAIAITYIMLANENDPFEKAKAFIKGYNSVIGLSKQEVELLYLLIPARLAVSVCNSAKKKAEGKADKYVLISEQPAWKLLRKWISINPTWINNFFLDAVDLPTNQLYIENLIQQRKKFTGKSLSITYKKPIYMTGSAFQYMYDHLGNTYLDMRNNIPQLGHCHPNISKIISKKIRQLNTNTRYLYPELTEYATALSKKLPTDLHKIFYVNSGSEASDLAIRMAKTHTKNNRVAILENGYHGSTNTGIAISDYKRYGIKEKPANIITLPMPKSYEGKFKTGEAYADDAIEIINKHIKEENDLAALIVESVSGCGGQVPLAEGYLKKLSPYLKANNILLITDEVQTGFGRLGKYFWGFEMHQIEPDIIIMGKQIGNGHPIAAAVTTAEIADSFANGMEFFSSFGGNPVSCAVALEVLKTIEEEDLQINTEQMGTFLKNGLLQLKDKFNCIGDVRGEGLFLGIEFIDSDEKPSADIASFIKEHLKENFILTGTDGPHNNVLKIKPPLCFNLENAKHFLKTIETSIMKASTICG